jgi:hypothetical protein
VRYIALRSPLRINKDETCVLSHTQSQTVITHIEEKSVDKFMDSIARALLGINVLWSQEAALL